MLEDLQAKGLESSTASENGSRCSLTALGQALLSTQRCLDNAQLVSEIRQAGLPLQDRRIYELLKLLQAGGWKWHALPSTAKKRSELQYDVNGGEKVFYIGLLPVKPYLACLLLSCIGCRQHVVVTTKPCWMVIGRKLRRAWRHDLQWKMMGLLFRLTSKLLRAVSEPERQLPMSLAWNLLWKMTAAKVMWKFCWACWPQTQRLRQRASIHLSRQCQQRGPILRRGVQQRGPS